MTNRFAFAGVLVSLSAHARKHGLTELEDRIAKAATAALLEIPGATDIQVLQDLAGRVSSARAAS